MTGKLGRGGGPQGGERAAAVGEVGERSTAVDRGSLAIGTARGDGDRARGSGPLNGMLCLVN